MREVNIHALRICPIADKARIQGNLMAKENLAVTMGRSSRVVL